jgi:hypothetical protein
VWDRSRCCSAFMRSSPRMPLSVTPVSDRFSPSSCVSVLSASRPLGPQQAHAHTDPLICVIHLQNWVSRKQGSLDSLQSYDTE